MFTLKREILSEISKIFFTSGIKTHYFNYIAFAFFSHHLGQMSIK